MSRSRKQTHSSRSKKPLLESLEQRALGARAAEQVKGGATPLSKPVARYHLENAWPSK